MLRALDGERRHELHVGVLDAVALLTSIASNVFMVGYFTASAKLVEASELPHAKGRLQATQALHYACVRR